MQRILSWFCISPEKTHVNPIHTVESLERIDSINDTRQKVLKEIESLRDILISLENQIGKEKSSHVRRTIRQKRDEIRAGLEDSIQKYRILEIQREQIADDIGLDIDS